MKISLSKRSLAAALCYLSFAFAAPAARAYTSCDKIGDINLNFGETGNLSQGARADGNFSVNCNSDGAGAGYCIRLQAGSDNFVLSSDTNNTEIPFILSGADGSSLQQEPLYDWAKPVSADSRNIVPFNLTGKISARILPQAANLPEGAYSKLLLITFLAGGKADIHDKEGWKQFCQKWDGNSVPPGASPPFQVDTISGIWLKLSVVKHCSVSNGGNIDFCKQYTLDKPLSAQGAVDVDCSMGTRFSLGIDSGRHSGGTKQRAMTLNGSNTDDADKRVSYDLCQDAACALPWGEGSERLKKTSDSYRSVKFPVYGRVPAQPGAKRAGAYRDTVVVTVTVE